MKRPKVTRAKGRFASGEHFALVPRAVMESKAWHGIPDWAKAVVFALAGQYRGSGNGDLSLTWPEARALGVSTEWKLRAGLKLAERVGLCVLTRPGGNVAGGEKRPTLWALGWLAIEQSPKFEAPPGTLLQPPNGWVRWVRPDDWATQIDAERQRAQGKKTAHHTREGQPAPTGWGGNDPSRHTREDYKGRSTATHGGATSRDLGREMEETARRLIDSQPHLTDFDIARAVRWRVDPAQVRLWRQSPVIAGCVQ